MTIEHTHHPKRQHLYDDRRRPIFDSAWYAAVNSDVRGNGSDPYEHFRLFGRYEGRAPSLYSPFDADQLPAPPLDQGPDWFLEQKRIIERSGLFDIAWYAREYSIDPPETSLDHFVNEGAYVGCDPSPFFSTVSYLTSFPDVLASGANPLSHFITDGYLEGRAGFQPARFAGRLEITETVWRTGRLEGHRRTVTKETKATKK